MLHLVAFVVAVLMLPLPGLAQETVFYRCTDAQGHVSMQNGTPCPAHMKQEIRRVGSVQTAPVRQSPPEEQKTPADSPAYGTFVLVSGPETKRQPAPEAKDLPPPPDLFQCRSWEGETYYSETDTPAPRCKPLEVVGIDGSAALGMGSACEMQQDQCTAIPEGQRCDAWYRRLDEAEFKLRYADARSRRQRQQVRDALATRIQESFCTTEVPKMDATKE